MRELLDNHYPEAERIRVALDNLNAQPPTRLCEAFLPPEARRLLRRLQSRRALKHASWLNMAEIELRVLVGNVWTAASLTKRSSETRYSPGRDAATRSG